MTCVNTTGAQDQDIEDARIFAQEIGERFSGDAETSINSLIETIRDLDRQISRWKAASECESPEELRSKIIELEVE